MSRHNILDTIVDQRRHSLKKQPLNLPDLDEIKPSTRSLYQVISRSEFGYILECKKASPSHGVIRSDFDIANVIEFYRPYATAVSVLTEPDFFQGRFEYLSYASNHCSVPILCKDFIVDEQQLYYARHCGADAVLLMLSVLSDREYQHFSQICKTLELDVLTEVHTLDEAKRANQLGADIVGINNRDLKTLKTDLSVTKTLAEQFSREQLIVTESGIQSHADVARLSLFADAALIGSSLMMRRDLSHAVIEQVYGDIKICAVTNQEDAFLLDGLPCTSIGQIFVPNTPRYCTIESKPIVTSKPKVGVFRDQSIEFVRAATVQHDLSGIQLHGAEPDEYIRQLKQELPKQSVIKALAVPESGARFVVKQVKSLLENEDISEVLLDTKSKNKFGGTGQTFDWTILNELTSNVALNRIRIAGGVTAENLRTLKEYGFTKFDVASGSEKSQGVKSLEKLDRLFGEAKLLGRRNDDKTV